MVEELDIAILSVPEDSTELVSGELMCRQAASTNLYLLSKRELPLLQRQQASVCIVPYIDGDSVEFALFETFVDRVNIRPMEVASEAGWSPRCPWIFKR